MSGGCSNLRRGVASWPNSCRSLTLSALGSLCVALAVGTRPTVAAVGPPLDLQPFEDDDCLEVDDVDLLLMFMHDMSDHLEQVLYSPEEPASSWAIFRRWTAENALPMRALAGALLTRPYCEPAKVSWMAAQCLLILGANATGAAEEALSCANALDEDLLMQMTPPGKSYDTRLNLLVRSPWPALRLLDLLVRLHPEKGSTRMGACRQFKNWQSDPDVFDWPHFKPLITATVDAVTEQRQLFDLRHEDGPLSNQYKARWLRVYRFSGIKDAIAFSDDVFDAYREHHYKAGCHIGVISSYVLQLLPLHLRDTGGCMQRVAASVAQLVNLHAPFSHMIKTDWPLFRLLYMASLLQRSAPELAWRGLRDARAPAGAAKVLCERVEKAIAPVAAADGAAVAYVTAAWGALARFSGAVLKRWSSFFDSSAQSSPLLLLALDAEGLRQCKETDAVLVQCIDAPRRLGIEGTVAKYIALAAIARLGVTAVWLDLDVYVASNPTPHVLAALGAPSKPDLVFARDLTSDSLVPAVVIARASNSAVDVLMKYAYWLRDNPFLLDHQGWDQFLDNRAGDFLISTDYKGRNITVQDKDGKGPTHSFLPLGVEPPSEPRYARLGNEFGSGDGWLGREDGRDICFFHFWGTDETQAHLFDLFYNRSKPSQNARGLSAEARSVLVRYRREPASGPSLGALLSSGNRRALHLVSVSYAHGCCQKSLQKNRQQALAVGVDDARAYGRGDLDPAWAAQHDQILSQKRGGGWWLWKPHVILKTLLDPAVPWGRGVVLWVDAGNFLHADPRPVVTAALRASDVVAMRLKLCIEADWTSAPTLKAMNVSSRYTVTSRPQLGAYFLMFRKTSTSIAFVQEWLRRSEEPEVLLGAAAARLAGQGGDSGGQKDSGTLGKLAEDMPSFQTHQADQSVFSILFKQYGFQALELDQGHKAVTLARWRE